MRKRLIKKVLVSVGAGQDISYIKGGMLENKKTKKYSMAFKKAELLFKKESDITIENINGKSVFYILKKKI